MSYFILNQQEKDRDTNDGKFFIEHSYIQS